MIKENYDFGAQFFSTGKSILLNWNNRGMILENPRLVSFNTNMSNYTGPESIVVFDSDRRMQIEKPLPTIEFEMKFVASDIKDSKKPFKFEDLVKENMTMEEMLKIAYSKIKKWEIKKK